MKKFKRQSEDYILTDLLAVEKGNFYTHNYFYEFLLEEKLNKFRKDEGFSSQIFSSYFHSAPLKFKTRKRKGFRELSLLNPLALLEAYFFIDTFGRTVVELIKEKNIYGQRIPIINKSLLYKYSNGQTVYYKDSMEKSQLLIDLEASGSHYSHKPHKKLHKFLDGNLNSYMLDKYDYLLQFDIENYFGSIYTHSFTWLIAKNHLDAMNFKSTNSIYSNIDTFLQNINGAKTNGIVVGPEISRMLAEFLIVNIEEKISKIIYDNGYINGKDYSMFRFVDDYFLYTNDKKIEEDIYNIIKNHLNTYHLNINSSKTREIQTISESNEWIFETKTLVNNIVSEIFVDVIQEDEALLTSKIERRYSYLKNRVQVLINKTGEREKIASYTLSAIVKMVENNKQKKINMSCLDFINFCFYLVGLYSSYVSIQKLIRILSLIEGYEHMDVLFIENAVERFKNKIFNGYVSDWIDLVLYFGSSGIRLSENLERKVVDKVLGKKDDRDPRLLAGISIYINSTKNTNRRKEYFKYVIDIININLERIDLDKFFKDEKSWWVIIFKNCPYKEFETTIQKIDEVLIKLAEKNSVEINEQDLSANLKGLTIKFLRTNKGFIDWDLFEKNKKGEVYFYTRNRTLFDTTRDDFLDISN